MRILSFIIGTIIILYIGLISASSNVKITATKLQSSPHGKDFKINCIVCHSADSWKIDTATYSFNHASTKMPLIGLHREVDCKQCHTSLVFSEEKTRTTCISCHKDIHNQTVGMFCENCHTPNSWLVNNITEIHQQSRFPLLGVHTMTECQKCHKSESLHQYNVLGVECIDCHQSKYNATSNPSHVAANFSTECSRCHYIYSYEWGGTGFNHSFFPLTLGHSGVSCVACHKNNQYTYTPTECVSCHIDNYNTATNPVHSGGCFNTNCIICHTTSPGWTPTSNSGHDSQFFPITSGNHAGISCNQCHTNPSDCGEFSCTVCHSVSSMNNEHDDVGGYSSANTACFSCHPKGEKP